MKEHRPSRKKHRFFVVNPSKERRNELRFESHESVIVRVEDMNKALPAVADEIARKGLRLRCEQFMENKTSVRISFPSSRDNVECFGHVAWARPLGDGSRFEYGVIISVWHGIVLGKNSWKKYRGIRPTAERRRKIR